MALSIRSAALLLAGLIVGDRNNVSKISVVFCRKASGASLLRAHVTAPSGKRVTIIRVEWSNISASPGLVSTFSHFRLLAGLAVVPMGIAICSMVFIARCTDSRPWMRTMLLACSEPV